MVVVINIRGKDIIGSLGIEILRKEGQEALIGRVVLQPVVVRAFQENDPLPVRRSGMVELHQILRAKLRVLRPEKTHQHQLRH